MDCWKVILTLCQTSIRSSADLMICPSVVITIYIQVIFKYIIIGNDFLFQADYNEFRFIILSIGRGAMQVYALKKLVFSTLF